MNNKVFETVQDLISNFAIVTAYLFLANQVIYKHRNLDSLASLYTKIHMGFVTGMLGIVLMIFSVQFKGTILDFRQLAIIIAALYGGIGASIITGIIVFLMRLFAFGDVNTASAIAATNNIIVAVGVGAICQMHFTYWRKWIYSLILCNILTGIVFLINLSEKGIAPLIIYTVMITVGGVLTASLIQFLIKAKAQFHRMEKESTYDFLTELNNHRTFDDVFNSSMQKAIEKNETLSLLFLDIDHFKKVNDTYGHVNGDAVLKQFGKLLKDTSRSFDNVSRNGGEEFSLILYDCPHKLALIIGDRIRIAVKNYDFVLNDGQKIKITVSVGAATYPDTNEDIIEQADSALYKAKSSGRNMVCSNHFEPKQIYRDKRT